MNKPLRSDLSLEEDAEYAKAYLQWLEELDEQLKARSVPDAIFHPEPLRFKQLSWNMQVMHFTDQCVSEVYFMKGGKLYLK